MRNDGFNTENNEESKTDMIVLAHRSGKSYEHMQRIILKMLNSIFISWDKVCLFSFAGLTLQAM